MFAKDITNVETEIVSNNPQNNSNTKETETPTTLINNKKLTIGTTINASKPIPNAGKIFLDAIFVHFSIEFLLNNNANP